MREGRYELAFGLVAASGVATFLGALGVLFAKDVTRAKDGDGEVGVKHDARADVVADVVQEQVGACASQIPSHAQIASRETPMDGRFLSGSMAASAGVMVYVSFVEILCVKATDSFGEAGLTPPVSRRYATLLFFAGVAATVLLDTASHGLAHRAQRRNRRAAEAIDGAAMESGAFSHPAAHHPTSAAGVVQPSAADLQQTGVLTALAIGIHNFPEGLATFMATMADPASGVAVAVAIALHNIPEGLAVAMPIYYGSGSKRKGVVWGVLSGLSEPLGGLFGYAVLRGTDLDPVAYGVLFAVVAGMMIYISIAELLPTAMAHDAPGAPLTTRCFIAGMAVMAASLLMFEA